MPCWAARYSPVQRTGPTRSGTGGNTASCAASAAVRTLTSWASRRWRTQAITTLSSPTTATVARSVPRACATPSWGIPSRSSTTVAKTAVPVAPYANAATAGIPARK